MLRLKGTNNNRALLSLHGAVLLFALSGLFAKWLTIPAFQIVLGRATFAAIALALFIILIQKASIILTSRKSFLVLVISGGVLAFHWTSFFYAIQVSSVAIGLITFASFPIFVSIAEPLIFKERFKWITVLQAFLIVLGICLVVPLGSINSSNIAGLVAGTSSAISFAVLTLINRKYVRTIKASVVAFHQNAWAALFLLPVIVISPLTLDNNEFLGLLILGVIFTALSHSLFNFSLKSISGQIASVAVSLEPVYGIVAAYLLLAEPLTFAAILGCAVVIATNIWALNVDKKSI